MPEPRVSADQRPASPADALRGGGETAMVAAATHGASGLRREILLRLRKDGPSSPDELASRIGASRTGVLQQLRALEEAGLVRHETERHGVGRPRHRYDVTEDAQDLFPTNYEGLAASLLEAIGAVGGVDLVEQVFAARRRQIGARVRSELNARVGSGARLADRVVALAAYQDLQGYVCEAEALADGSVVLREHNCAILRVARRTTAACDNELALFREVLGADVVRESHIASGDRCCTYRIVDHVADRPA